MESESDSLTSSIVGFCSVGPMAHTISSVSGSQQAAVMSGCRQRPNRRFRRLRIVAGELWRGSMKEGSEEKKIARPHDALR